MGTARQSSTSPTISGAHLWSNLPCVDSTFDDIDFTIDVAGTKALVRRKHVKNLNLRITRDGTVELSIPMRCSRARAREFVLSHVEWIARNLDKVEERQALEATYRYDTGDETFVWGKPLTIRVEPTAYSRSSTRLGSDRVTLHVPFDHLGSSDEAVTYRREMIARMRKRELLRALPGVAARCERRVGVTCEDWHVRRMRTRWGTCHVRDARIWLNLELAAHPVECLEYVACHELCHLLVPDHSPAFYAELSRAYPDWERISSRLKATPLLP